MNDDLTFKILEKISNDGKYPFTLEGYDDRIVINELGRLMKKESITISDDNLNYILTEKGKMYYENLCQIKEILDEDELKEKPIELPTSYDVVDLIETNLPEPEYVVDKLLIKNSNSMIASPQKSYKTFSAVYMGICIAMGWDFLNFKVKQSNVLYCDCESPVPLAKKRIIQIENGRGQKFDRNKFIYDFTDYDLNSDESLNELKEKISKNKIEVVFFDVLRGFVKNIRESNADDVREWYQTKLKPLKDKFGLTIVLITHTRKAKPEYTDLDRLENIRGSSELTNFSEIVLGLDRKGFENYADWNVLKNRYAQEIEKFGVTYDFDDAEKKLVLNQVDREIWLKSKTTSYVKPMWEWILERDQETFMTKEFKEQLKRIGVEKGRDMVAKRVLDDLINMGRINKSGRGVYQRITEKQATL